MSIICSNKKIKIVDKPTNGSILVYLEVDVLEGDEVYSQYELQLAARSNGGDQNTIEIQKAKKKYQEFCQLWSNGDRKAAF